MRQWKEWVACLCVVCTITFCLQRKKQWAAAHLFLLQRDGGWGDGTQSLAATTLGWNLVRDLRVVLGMLLKNISNVQKVVSLDFNLS